MCGQVRARIRTTYIHTHMGQVARTKHLLVQRARDVFFSSSASSRVQYGVRVVNDVNVQVSQVMCVLSCVHFAHDYHLDNEGKVSATDSSQTRFIEG